MEQAIAFVLGVWVVLAIANVISMFKTRGQVKDLYAEIEDLQDLINELERDRLEDTNALDLRIDAESERTDQVYEELHGQHEELLETINENLDRLSKYIDSRTDKMEERMKDNVAKLIADVYSNMEAKFNDNTSFVDGLYHSIKELTKKKKK